MTTQEREPLDPAALVGDLDRLLAERDRLAAENAALREKVQLALVLVGRLQGNAENRAVYAALAGEGVSAAAYEDWADRQNGTTS